MDHFCLEAKIGSILKMETFFTFFKILKKGDFFLTFFGQAPKGGIARDYPLAVSRWFRLSAKNGQIEVLGHFVILTDKMRKIAFCGFPDNFDQGQLDTAGVFLFLKGNLIFFF